MCLETAVGIYSNLVMAHPGDLDSLSPTVLGEVLAVTFRRELHPFSLATQKIYQVLRIHLSLEQLGRVGTQLALTQNLSERSTANLRKLQQRITLGPEQQIPIDTRYIGTSREAEIISLMAPIPQGTDTLTPPTIDYRTPKDASEMRKWVHGTITEELLQRLTALNGEGQKLARQLGPTINKPSKILLDTGQKLTRNYQLGLLALQRITDDP